MLIRNATPAVLEAAALAVGLTVRELRPNPRGRGYLLRLGFGADRDHYRRLSGTAFRPNARIDAVCFHGYLAFFRALYQKAPEAVIKTQEATFTSAADLEAKQAEVGDVPKGIYFAPTPYRQACLCQ